MLKKTLAMPILAVLLSAMFSMQAHASWANYLEKTATFRACLKTPVTEFDGTIAEAALATESLSTLVFALETAGLVDVFLGEGNFTVFAPVNDAFGSIPGGLLEAILADTDLLTAVLTYHVVDGQPDPRRAWRASKSETLNGQSVFYSRGDEGARVNNSNIIDCQGIKTSNGTVWLIDSVLLPQFLQQVENAEEDEEEDDDE